MNILLTDMATKRPIMVSLDPTVFVHAVRVRGYMEEKKVKQKGRIIHFNNPVKLSDVKEEIEEEEKVEWTEIMCRHSNSKVLKFHVVEEVQEVHAKYLVMLQWQIKGQTMSFEGGK